MSVVVPPERPVVLDVQHHPAVEEYLETIYHLEESGVPAMRARLVQRLHVSAPAVSEQVKRLEREGFVTLAADRTVVFTAQGRSYATDVVRRHRLAERLLVDILGLPWHQVHEEAGRLEHAISPVLEERLVTLLDDPVTCPHGNPIPGSRRPYEPGPTRLASAAPAGADVRLIRVEEELQADHDVLVALERIGAVPGSTLRIGSAATGTVQLTGPAGSISLTPAQADGIVVSA